MKLYTGKIEKKREATSMEEKVNETTAQVDTELNKNKNKKAWETIHGAIFDVDGTLLDSMVIWEEAAVRYLHSLGLEPEENLSEKIMTMSMEEGADYVIEHYGVNLTRKEILNGIRELIRGFYEDEVQLKPGVEQVIKTLSDKKIPMIIATSSDSACVTAGLKRLGVWKYFKGILTCTDIGKGKTEPDIYLAAAKEIGSKPSETVVFEDALHAIVTAKKAGFVTVGIYDSYNQDEKEIRKVADYYYKSWDDVSKAI